MRELVEEGVHWPRLDGGPARRAPGGRGTPVAAVAGSVGSAVAAAAHQSLHSYRARFAFERHVHSHLPLSVIPQQWCGVLESKRSAGEQ